MARSTLVVLVWWSVFSSCGAPSQPDSGAGGGGGGGGEVTCPAGQTRCGVACVNLKTSNGNCGFCGNACDATSQCVLGGCLPNDCSGADCADGQICSGGQCLHRGCVGVTCSVGTDCVEGTCVPEACGSFSCPAGLACVSGCCEDVQCSGVICASGRCEFGRCVPGGTGGGGGNNCGFTGGGGGTTGGGGGATGGGGGSSDGGSDAGEDAGTDAGRDAGTDAGSDAGADAGRDAGTDAGTDAGVTPVIIFSDVFDGTSIASSPNSQPVYGRISGLASSNAQSCWETVGLTSDGGLISPDAGLCGTNDAAWLNLPDGQWSYDTPAQLWRWVIPPPFPPNRYRFFARDVATRAKAVPVVLNLTGPTLIFSDAVNGPAKTDFVMSAAFHGRITQLTASNGEGCTEPVTATNCLNFANWSSLTALGWTYDPAAGVWRKTFPINGLSSGEYKFYARNTQDLSQAPIVVLTITP